MNSTKKTSTLLVGALFLAGTLAMTADAQQGPKDGAKAGATRQAGPGDGTGAAPAPKDGTGYGKSKGKGSTAPGACDGTGPKGSSGSRGGGSGKSGSGGGRGGRG
jgi:ribonuclease R